MSKASKIVVVVAWAMSACRWRSRWRRPRGRRLRYRSMPRSRAIDELKRGHDRTREVAPEALGATTLALTRTLLRERRGRHLHRHRADPIDGDNQPDPWPVAERVAVRLPGGSIPRGGRRSSMKARSIRASPRMSAGPRSSASAASRAARFPPRLQSGERINPVDQVHRVETIVKSSRARTQKCSNCWRRWLWAR